MAIKDSYPTIRPALNINFAGSRIVDPRITFSRSGTGNVASYFDEKGVMKFAPPGAPRIDFDPVTGECKGLLIEEQRTNLLTYSEQLDNAEWNKSRMTVATNATTAPDGTISADKLVEDTTASATHGIAPSSFSAVSGTPYTFSVYLRASDTRRLQVIFLAAAFGTNLRATFNVVAGTVVTNGGTATITPIGAGFYRCTFTATATATVTTNININLANADTADLAAISYTGDGTSGIYIWGAQLEEGAFPTSYIPTTTAQVTRAADRASMTGANFSSWYLQDEGTFAVELSRFAALAQFPAVQATDGTTSNAIRAAVWGALNTPVFTSIVGGVDQTTIVSTAAGANVSVKIAGAYRVNDYAAAFSNYPTVQTDTSALVPSVNQLLLGYAHNTHVLNGHIKRIAYYPKRLSNTNLQALSA